MERRWRRGTTRVEELTRGRFKRIHFRQRVGEGEGLRALVALVREAPRCGSQNLALWPTKPCACPTKLSMAVVAPNMFAHQSSHNTGNNARSTNGSQRRIQGMMTRGRLDTMASITCPATYSTSRIGRTGLLHHGNPMPSNIPVAVAKGQMIEPIRADRPVRETKGKYQPGPKCHNNGIR